jgi:hypothetical protein
MAQATIQRELSVRSQYTPFNNLASVRAEELALEWAPIALEERSQSFVLVA